MPQSASLSSCRVRSIISIAALASLICLSAFGSDRYRSIKQLYRTSWTAKDGVPTPITGSSTTSDSYLPLASHQGFFRFDGLRLDTYQPPPGVSFLSYSIFDVATRHRGRWVAFDPSDAAFQSLSPPKNQPSPTFILVPYSSAPLGPFHFALDSFWSLLDTKPLDGRFLDIENTSDSRQSRSRART
jgi:hypothetical protein